MYTQNKLTAKFSFNFDLAIYCIILMHGPHYVGWSFQMLISTTQNRSTSLCIFRVRTDVYINTTEFSISCTLIKIWSKSIYFSDHFCYNEFKLNQIQLLPVVGVESLAAKSSQLASNIGAASALSWDGNPTVANACGSVSLWSSTDGMELNPDATLSTMEAAVAKVVAVRSEVEEAWSLSVRRRGIRNGWKHKITHKC